MKAGRFLLRCHPGRALVEAWLLGLGILGLLAVQVGIVSPFVLANGLLFLCGAGGMWAVLRARLPEGGWRRRLVWELGTALALSLVMALGIILPGKALGWQQAWTGSNITGEWVVIFLLLGTGPGYLLARVGVRAWLAWERLRRRRMLWAITHAQLSLVVLLACVSALVIFVLSPYSRLEALLQPDAASLLASLTERLLHTFFPAASMIVLMTILALLVLLPPAAIFSYLVAHKTTRRLEALAAATDALRAGQYSTRVDVSGEDEVGQLQANLNAMAEELERTLRDLEVQRDAVTRLFEARRQLVASVSHELRTPVATLRALLESALDHRGEMAPAWLGRDLEVMDSEVLRLQRLLDDLFTLSQAEAGGLTVDCRPTDVAPLVQRMVDAAAPLAWESRRVDVVADPGPGPALAVVDGARLEQVLANLLHNGVRHTPPGGIVAAVVRAEDGAVVVEVQDTGEGIAAESLPHIWERFFHGPEGGAGLGLALVKELTEAMGGQVAVESTPGRGTCFTLRLPRA